MMYQSPSISSEKQEFSLYGKTLPYLLKRGKRRTMQISIHPNQEIVVHAPKQASMRQIEELLEKKQRWINKTLQKLEQLPPPLPQRQYICGETHYYLGRQYRLKIHEGENQSIKLKGGFFEIIVSDKENKSAIAQLLMNWYLDRAKVIFSKHLEQCLKQTRNILSLPEKQINLKIRPMRTRWGSCSSRGNINLNLELIKTPLNCIDYVIIHELCHLKQMNHSKDFWLLVGQCMPQWQKYKSQLDKIRLENI
ncbi:M48 family metallopeptidase [Cyanobacterium aponinum FACHB-4101]|uniref:M48 family metallopeptidase n=1 Tax=Cyanobacterium aponinum TaxID=379064 RepID=UPI001680A12C|nr:SprT family zinc-dependent metalloprotease [Cyanobacterium aponinum]MBD2395854.1 M48 family metallopeptidase [Cyanobacterium aponinum FACHB-4101]